MAKRKSEYFSDRSDSPELPLSDTAVSANEPDVKGNDPNGIATNPSATSVPYQGNQYLPLPLTTAGGVWLSSYANVQGTDYTAVNRGFGPVHSISFLDNNPSSWNFGAEPTGLHNFALPPPAIQGTSGTAEDEKNDPLSGAPQAFLSSDLARLMHPEFNVAVIPAIYSVPGDNDVLLGRGRTHVDHPGNRRMQLLVDIHRDAYDKADRDDKTDMTKSIIKIIQAKGGRFLKLKKNPGTWEEVSETVARNKVSHAMRDGRKKPLGVIDLREIEELPMLPDHIRRTAVQMSSLHQQIAQNAFGEKEAEILQNFLFSPTPQHSSAEDIVADSKPAASTATKKRKPGGPPT